MFLFFLFNLSVPPTNETVKWYSLADVTITRAVRTITVEFCHSGISYETDATVYCHLGEL